MDAELDRRRFLVLTAAGFAGVAWAASGASCVTADAPREVDPLTSARTRARERGLPVLVMLADPSADGESERTWSAYLEGCSDRAQAHLALSEIAFVSIARARREWSESTWLGTRDSDASAPFALVAAPGASAAVLVTSGPMGGELTFSDAEFRAEIAPWIARTERSLNAAIAPDPETFDRLAVRALGHAPTSHEAATAELARVSRARFAHDAPAGARWAVDSGSSCGVSVPCGAAMLRVPSQRFLKLYTSSDR